MNECRFNRAILTGEFDEKKEKSDFTVQDILKMFSSFSGIQPEKLQKYNTIYGMINQSIFGYGIKIHRYETLKNENNLIKSFYGKEFYLNSIEFFFISNKFLV